MLTVQYKIRSNYHTNDFQFHWITGGHWGNMFFLCDTGFIGTFKLLTG